jgi:large subunit ribosomal protein L17
MRHRNGVAKLSKTPSHRRAMLRNMVTSLLRHERITTTAPKAKEAKRWAERMITLGKRGDLHARRQAASFVNDETVLKKLFDEIAPAFKERQGGYTRVLRTGVRKGDVAEVAILELVTKSPARTKPVNHKTRERLMPFQTKARPGRKPAAAAQSGATVEQPAAAAAPEGGAPEAEAPETPGAEASS